MERTIKKFTICCMLVAAVSCGLMFYFGNNHDNVVLAREQRQLIAEQEKAELEKMSGLELMEYYTDLLEEIERQEARESELSRQLRLQLPRGITFDDITVENDYVTKIVSVQIPTEDADYFYNYPMVGNSDSIHDLQLSANGKTAVMEIMLDDIYELDITAKNDYVYFDFISPHELYDKIVVVDAGHGGTDPGALSSTGELYEKDIDLQILLKLKQIFDKQDEVKVYYTRTEDTTLSLASRVSLANELDADLFLSIHNNSVSTSGADKVKGTEVMYNEAEENSGHGSLEFAQICLEELCAGIGSRNLGLVSGSGIHIIRESEVPVALVEVGFVSNDAEFELLCDDAYQQKAAESLYRAIMRAFEEGF